MAGINNANKLVSENKNIGKVLYKGEFEDEGTNLNFLIIKLDNDNGTITQFDYASDLIINKNIEIGDRVELHVLDDYSAEWRPEK